MKFLSSFRRSAIALLALSALGLSAARAADEILISGGVAKPGVLVHE